MRYERPNFLTKRVLNTLTMGLGRLGISLRGSRTLVVRGRKTGVERGVPVNPLTLDGARYLVAPRGETHWVRNLRAAGTAELRLGGKREMIRVEELTDDAKAPVLRGYLKHWAMETGRFFDRVKADAPDEEIARIAPRHPVFRILQG